MCLLVTNKQPQVLFCTLIHSEENLQFIFTVTIKIYLYNWGRGGGGVGVTVLNRLLKFCHLAITKKHPGTESSEPLLSVYTRYPLLLSVPSLKKCSLVCSQQQYEEQPRQQHQPRCLLDRRITETKKQEPCIWSLAAVWVGRWSSQTRWCDNFGRLPVIPACALSVLKRHYPNLSPEFQPRSLPAVGHRWWTVGAQSAHTSREQGTWFLCTACAFDLGD